MSNKSLQTEQSNWRMRALMTGGVLGSLLGITAAYFYVRAAEEASEGNAPKRVPTGDAIKLGTALFTIVRQVAELGARK